MNNWKQTVAAAIVTPTLPPVTDPVAGGDLSLACALKVAIDAGRVAPGDLSFAQSLYEGHKKYGRFTDRQRPHAFRLASSQSAPVAGPDAPLAAALEAALPYVAAKDHGFALSLLSGYKRYGSFTDRQRPYAQSLANCFPASLIETPPPATPVEAPVKPVATTCPNICSKVGLNGFSRFTVGKLALSLKNDGSVIWVKWDGRVAGSIDTATTEYRETRRYLAAYALAEARKALRTVEADPLAAARENGVLTGRCSCCGRPLTDPVSIGYGLGPVCRERGFGVTL